MPPKGWKKGYVQDPKTGNWVDPRTLKKSEPKKPVAKPKVTISRVKKTGPKDDLGATTKNTPVGSDHARIIVSYTDEKKRPRTIQYTMDELNIQENRSEDFVGSRKKTRITLTIDGTVLEKM